ncbi:rosmarinate synthase-like [Nicotiana sylvestris]|uniref:Rosmarinate synthase-like n=1 Tax=Nicotiana sylvestris TaxID=4096 RepID=A0A1U7X2C1_NICSY|nr:PREDICTED: rosmarinate synthase-like [Nicotiana sylvestris]
MANCNGNGVAHLGSNLQIEAIQTVIPIKPTDPRLSRRVAIGENLGSVNFQSRFHIVLCYNKASEEDSGWLVAGWIKESLGKALVEKPLFAGRLKRKGENDNSGEFEIVSNDSGVRLVEANMPMDLADFLDILKERKNAEAELVFWEDVNESNPQYSPLFYVQVTNFKCGRYSIGISCSLFLADPYGMTSFLNIWSKIHNNIISEAGMPKIPTFFLPNHRKNGCSPTLSTSSTTSKQINETLIFKLPSKIFNFRDNIHKNLAEKCVEETEDKLGKKLSSKFCLFVREISEDVKVETFFREGISSFGSITGLVSVCCDDLEAQNIRFNEENKAVHSSCWISNSGNEDLVLITPTFVLITPFL